jgi:synaptosomal-associated protein 25
MQSSNKNGEQGGEELSGIQRQINQTTNESLESTRRMLGLVIESEEVGNKTMVMLDQQGEKLDQIEVKKFFLFY